MYSIDFKEQFNYQPTLPFCICRKIITGLKGNCSRSIHGRDYAENYLSMLRDSLFQALGLWGRAKKRASAENDRGGKGWCKHREGHCFSCKHKGEGQTIWCMSLRGWGGGSLFLCKVAGVKEVNLEFL